MFREKNVVMGVTGGIACYKAADVVSRLTKLGINVDVIMTDHACEFVNPLTFRTLSGNPVVRDTFETPKEWKVGHISLAKKADIMLIAPATANIIGKVANGIADDMLSTTIMASRAFVVFAPAMNVNMYENPILQENISKLKKLGYLFIEPEEGLLACGDTGKGRMAEPVQIESYITDILAKSDSGKDTGGAGKRDMEGIKVLVTAGPTAEDIDPVRYITNRSTGKMGFAIAEAAFARGADVTLVSGPVSLGCSPGIDRIDVRSTEDMLSACLSVYDRADVVIKAAAPADFKIKERSVHKIKKGSSDGLTIELIKNPDILKTLGENKGDRILVGFAAETRDVELNAKKKLESKNLDMIVANNVSSKGAGFAGDTNIVTIYRRNGAVKEYGKMSKSDIADIILDNVLRVKKDV